jgi:hypothetical protein
VWLKGNLVHTFSYDVVFVLLGLMSLAAVILLLRVQWTLEHVIPFDNDSTLRPDTV